MWRRGKELNEVTEKWRSSNTGKGKQNTVEYDSKEEGKLNGTNYKRKGNINDCS